MKNIIMMFLMMVSLMAHASSADYNVRDEVNLPHHETGVSPSSDAGGCEERKHHESEGRFAEGS